MTRERPTIRPAIAADEPRLRAIQSAALAEPWPELLSAAIGGPPAVLVAETDRPVGYALVVPGEDAAYLAEIAVAPPEQGRGHGSALLERVLARLAEDGVARLRLTVRADDDRARAFYDGFDFRAVDRVPDHYEDCDGLLLERNLGDGADPEEDGADEDGADEDGADENAGDENGGDERA